ncbi:MAG: hypothetical protein JJU33_11605 [Phycisphaerales bacterium]|nr:hypothetical protein [Phycisphaerales bacterium]
MAVLLAAVLALLWMPSIAVGQADTKQAIREKLQLDSFDLVALDLPSDVGEGFILEIELEGQAFEIQMFPHSVRAPDFEVWLHDGTGEAKVIDVPEPRTVRGTGLGEQEVAVVGSLREVGLSALAIQQDLIGRKQQVWVIQPLLEIMEEVTIPGQHVVYRLSSTSRDLGVCGVCGDGQNHSAHTAQHHSIPASTGLNNGDFQDSPQPETSLYIADIAYDTDADYYLHHQSDPNAVVDAVESIQNNVSFLYEHSLDITYFIRVIHVRSDPATDPYTHQQPQLLLDQFAYLWSSDPQYAGVDRSVAHLITGKWAVPSSVGGIAMLSGVCVPNRGYGLTYVAQDSFDTMLIVAHELGHNWSAVHCDEPPHSDPDCGLMTRVLQRHLHFGTRSTNDIAMFRDSRECLSGAGCIYTVVPLERTVPSDAGSHLIGVGANRLICQWDVASNDDWITIMTGTGGSGGGSVIYEVSEHTGASPRVGTITVAGQVHEVTQEGGGCGYAISPTEMQVASGAVSGLVNVLSPSGCEWTAVSSAPWITIEPGSQQGSGSEPVLFSVSANASQSPRVGTVTIQDNIFVVTQDGVVCSYELDSSIRDVPADEMSYILGVTASLPDCEWTAQSNDPWIVVTHNHQGTGNQTVVFKVLANQSSSMRTGTLTVAGYTHTVRQSGADCNYELGSPGRTVSAAQATYSLDVTATHSFCPWSAQSNAPWISIVGGAMGQGNDVVQYRVDANQDTMSREGTITVAGNTFVVSQQGVACTIAIEPSTRTVSADEHTGLELNVSASPSTCSWAAESNVPWIVITDNPTGTGDDTVVYTVVANDTIDQREGEIVVGSETHTVVQAPVECFYDLGPPSHTVPPSGGEYWFGVDAQPSTCEIAVVSTVDWVEIIDVDPFGNVDYRVFPNNTPDPRQTEFVIGNATHSVWQSSAAICDSFVDPPSRVVDGYGGQFDFMMFISLWDPMCVPEPSTNESWIEIVSVTITGTGLEVVYNVDENDSWNGRGGWIDLGDEAHEVIQEPLPCEYSFNNATVTVPASGGQFVEGYTVYPWDCEPDIWMIWSSPPIDVLSIDVSAQTIEYQVEANASTEPRDLEIILEAEVLNIHQLGAQCPADLNGDGVVDADDFFLFLQLFAQGDPRADFNNDGVIDADDFFEYLGAFAAGC